MRYWEIETDIDVNTYIGKKCTSWHRAWLATMRKMDIMSIEVYGFCLVFINKKMISHYFKTCCFETCPVYDECLKYRHHKISRNEAKYYLIQHKNEIINFKEEIDGKNQR